MTGATRELLMRVADIARRASQEILEVYASGEFAASLKSDSSPLTAADLRAHRLIMESLEALTPDVPVLSEESAHSPFAVRAKWGRYWLVDPLDGTRDVYKRQAHYRALLQTDPVVAMAHAGALRALRALPAEAESESERLHARHQWNERRRFLRLGQGGAARS